MLEVSIPSSRLARQAAGRRISTAVTFRGKAAIFGAWDVALKVRSHVLPLGLEVAGAGGGPLAPRPELTGGVRRTALLAGGHAGLGVVGAHPGVVTEVGGVLLVTDTVGGGAEVTRGTLWKLETCNAEWRAVCVWQREKGKIDRKYYWECNFHFPIVPRVFLMETAVQRWKCWNSVRVLLQLGGAKHHGNGSHFGEFSSLANRLRSCTVIILLLWPAFIMTPDEREERALCSRKLPAEL